MSFRKKVRKNVPKVELHSIMSLVVGSYKTGKTRLWKEVTERHYKNPEEALLLAFEPGYETWELENFIPVLEGYDEEEKPNKTGEDWEVWDYFRNIVVKGLVQEAKNERVVKLIGIDTADRLIDYCTAWLLYTKGKKYAKEFASLQEISNITDENGWTLLYEELKRQIDLLRNSGYGILTLAWTKEKETTLYNGMKYNSVELMMSNTGRKVFESQASLICCLHNEVKVFDKDGKELEENLKDKKGKEKASNFHETQTYMYFRPSEYISIAGGRYTELPEKVPYSAENFLQVFEEAVLGQLKNTDKSVDELREKEIEKREEKAKEFAEQVEKQENNSPEVLIAAITEKVDGLPKEEKMKLATKFKEHLGFADYKKSKDADGLRKCLEELSE